MPNIISSLSPVSQGNLWGGGGDNFLEKDTYNCNNTGEGEGGGYRVQVVNFCAIFIRDRI